jgi:hypothetical protein
MSNVGEGSNEQDQEEQQPLVSRKPTREDLKEAAHAAREAAAGAEQAAQAAAESAHSATGVVNTILAALETGPSRLPQAEGGDAESPADEDEEADMALSAEDLEGDDEEGDLRSGRPGQGGTGPAAQATGHGMMRGGPRSNAPAAFEQFMAALRDPLRKAGRKVRVTEIAGWVKIEGQQGHKVYIAKTVTGVSRVESTLDPKLVKGAKAPDEGRRRNGRIASWLPARPESVAQAIDVLARLEEPIPAPVRGAPGRR